MAAIVAVSFAIALAYSSRLEIQEGMFIFPIRLVRRVTIVFGIFISSRDIIYMSAMQDATAVIIVKTRLYSGGGRFRWRFSKPKLEDGVRSLQPLCITRRHVAVADISSGLRCPESLHKGQFVDSYRGEIITDEEAQIRETKRSVDDNNYLMNLDKHTLSRLITPEELESLVTPKEFQDIKERVEKGSYPTGKEGESDYMLWLNPLYKPPYVIDGMNHGSPSRFMNHSCQPNCRIFTVSYNHADTSIYDIAFFTTQVIEAGTELTFDYKDEDDRGVITDEMADDIYQKHGYRPTRCLCGSRFCRGYFFNWNGPQSLHRPLDRRAELKWIGQPPPPPPHPYFLWFLTPSLTRWAPDKR